MVRSTPLTALLLLVASTTTAQQVPRLDVRTPPESGLCDAVRVQLATRAEVRCGGAASDLSPPELTAWLTAPDAQGDRKLLARDAHGHVQEQPLARAAGPALERSVALKLSEWWEQRPSEPPAVSAPAAVLPQRVRADAVGALGGTFTGPVGDRHVQPALWGALGVSLSFRPSRTTWQLGPAFQLAMRPTWSKPPRSLSMTDRSVGMWSALHWPLGPVRLGLWGQALAHRIEARSKVLAYRDQDKRTLWGLSTGIALQVPITRHLSVEGAVGLEALPHRQRYLVANQPVAQLGHARGVGRITLQVHWPSVE